MDGHQYHNCEKMQDQPYCPVCTGKALPFTTDRELWVCKNDHCELRMRQFRKRFFSLRAYECQIRVLRAEATRREDEIRTLREALRRCIAHAGCPDCARGCRLVITTAKEVLKPGNAR